MGLVILEKSKRPHLRDALNWDHPIDSVTMLTKNAEFASVFRYTPRDLASSSDRQLVVARDMMNRAIQRFGGRWAVQFWTSKYETTDTDISEWPDPVSERVDADRRRMFETPGKQLCTEHYITVLYSPPDNALGDLAAAFENKNKDARSKDQLMEAQLEIFRQGRRDFLESMTGAIPAIVLCELSEMLTYLRNTVSLRRRKVHVLPLTVPTAEYLTDDDFLGGREPMLGDHHLRTIRIYSLPDSTHPIVLRALEKINFPYRLSANWIPFDREAGVKLMEQRKKAQSAKRFSMFYMVFSKFLNFDKDKHANTAALIKTDAADEALTEARMGDIRFGFWQLTVTLLHEDIHILRERCQIVQSAIWGAGFKADIARDDAAHCWLGSIPMHPHADLRWFLGSLMSFCDIMPSTAVWEGHERDHHLNGPPILRGISENGIPFRMVLHPPGSDVGHTVLIGESGAGKSTLIDAICTGHRRYAGSRIFRIGRDFAEKVNTICLGGEHHTLGGGDASTGLQPFRNVHEPAERSWANQLICGILEHAREPATSQQIEQISHAFERMGEIPVEQRTFTVLRALIQDHRIKTALSRFCLGGADGDLLDNSHSGLSFDADIICYETASLLKNRASAAGPVLATIFHEIERSLDGRPTMLWIDEAWAALEHPLLSSMVINWLKTGRKKELAVCLATQSLADIPGNPQLMAAVVDGCKNRIITANSEALEPVASAVFEKFGFSMEKIGIISRLRPKAEYVFTRDGMWRSFELRMTPVELAFCGRSRPADLTAFDRLLAQYGPKEIADRWLAHLGLAEHDAGKRMWATAAE